MRCLRWAIRNSNKIKGIAAFSKKRNNYNTNIDSFHGKTGYVIEDITYLKPGAVKIGDVSWTAIPVSRDEKIVENEIIEVVAVNGNKLIVKKVEGK